MDWRRRGTMGASAATSAAAGAMEVLRVARFVTVASSAAASGRALPDLAPLLDSASPIRRQPVLLSLLHLR